MARNLTIVWLRRDLRIQDNAALLHATKEGAVLPLYIWDGKADLAPGGAGCWWLHYSLLSLSQSFQQLKSRLVILKGKPLVVLRDLIRKFGASSVFWNRLYDPEEMQLDREIMFSLERLGVQVRTFYSNLLFDPGDIKNRSGRPYQVFTPFWKALLAAHKEFLPQTAPRSFESPRYWPVSHKIEDLRLLPRSQWADGIEACWRPGEAGALKMLRKFLMGSLGQYSKARNYPAIKGVSRLSPYLHFGEIGPRQVWHAVISEASRRRSANFRRNAEAFLRQIGWREFAHHLLYHFPRTPKRPLRKSFEKFPWKRDIPSLKAWQKGRTGYPIVDAGMRELWQIGWMHNRIRMIVASFLTKDLLLPWQEGAKWFWDMLVDADLANNTFGWQWVSGCGADAAPYFRIFHPVLQGEKFDPEGIYVRKWVPELTKLPNRWIHKPWNAPTEVLMRSGIKLGTTYPRPIVDHDFARRRALLTYKRIKTS